MSVFCIFHGCRNVLLLLLFHVTLADYYDVEKLESPLINNNVASDAIWIPPPECQGEATYNITIIFVDEDENDNKRFPEKVKAPVLEAAGMWSRAIVRKKLFQSMSNSNVSFVDGWENYCGMPEGTMMEIDATSLVVCVSYRKLEDEETTIGGEQLAQASPMIAESVQFLPILSFVGFNAENENMKAHYDYSDYANLAFHEIAHALGFSPVTHAFYKMLTGAKRNFLNGTNVIREWKALGATSLPYPVTSEDQGHWSSNCFFDEVMLPYLNKGKLHRQEDGRKPFSRLSLAVFEDIGYEVNYGCTDKMSLGPNCIAKHHPSFKRFSPRTVAKWAIFGAVSTVGGWLWFDTQRQHSNLFEKQED